jgi:hypothetical protein
MTQKTLFTERARTTDPITSHKRASKLTKSIKLTEMVLSVLTFVGTYPNETARHLGVIMHQQSGITDHIEWPHKVMSRLVEAGYVTRRIHDGGMRCLITMKGLLVIGEKNG